jgi:hydroxyacylglutathione hydrolase
MNVHVLPAGPLQTNAYLLTAPDRKEAVLIDAPLDVWDDVEPILRSEGCVLRELWFTHGHFDHLDGGGQVLEAAKLTIRGHSADRLMFEQPERMRWFIDMFLPGHPRMKPVVPTLWLEAGDSFEALGARVEVRHVPGHCDGNVAYWFPEQKVAFVGDSIFAGSIGRTDLPGGSFDVLAKSIREQIYTLPEETVLYPGHGPRTTVGAEKKANPYVRP